MPREDRQANTSERRWGGGNYRRRMLWSAAEGRGQPYFDHMFEK